MATASALLTVDEFLRLPEHEGERVDLIEGDVVTVAGANFPHERVKARVARLLGAWLTQNPLGEVFSETMYRLDEHSSLQPDVSVLLNERIGPEIEGLYPGAPDIAIEIVSSETAAYICRTRSTSAWSTGAAPCGCSIPSPRGS
jgi:Uma2 family endonuclease